MKDKKVLIATAVAIAVVVVLIVLNPFGLGGISPSGNSSNSTGQPPDTSTWIGPGKVFISNYTAGKTVEFVLQVHNGNNVSAEFSVDYRVPDFVADGYSRPTTEVRDWVGVEKRRPVIGAYQTMNITIWIGMPSYGEAPGERWEFWIGVIDQTQTGMIQTELGQRVLVTMGVGNSTASVVYV